MLNYHTNLVESRHFDFAPDLPDFRGGAFPRVVRFLVDTSIATKKYDHHTQIYTTNQPINSLQNQAQVYLSRPSVQIVEPRPGPW